MTDDDFAASCNEAQQGFLPDHLGQLWTEIRHGFAKGSFVIQHHHMAPNGYLHAGSLVTLADTACGYGCRASAPAQANGFTTIELKTNFLGTAREGVVVCEAVMVRGGRTTQVWDATCRHEETGRVMALFRCTQMVLYSKA